MTIEATVNIEQMGEHISSRNWNFLNLGAIFSFFGGISAIMIGSILTVEVWLFRTEIWHISIQSVINGFFYSALPLMFLGAYCLDKIDENKKKYSNENQK